MAAPGERSPGRSSEPQLRGIKDRFQVPLGTEVKNKPGMETNCMVAERQTGWRECGVVWRETCC